MQLKEEIEHLKRVCKPNEHICVVIWCVDDVLERAVEIGEVISKKEAEKIIEKMEDNHDAGIGINWTTIDHEIYDRVSERIDESNLKKAERNTKEKVGFT